MSPQLKLNKELSSPVYRFYVLAFRGGILTPLFKLIIRIFSDVYSVLVKAAAANRGLWVKTTWKMGSYRGFLPL